MIFWKRGVLRFGRLASLVHPRSNAGVSHIKSPAIRISSQPGDAGQRDDALDTELQIVLNYNYLCNEGYATDCYAVGPLSL